MRRTPLLFLALVLLAGPRAVASQSSPAGSSAWRGVARLGLEYGGDKVVQFRYEDGSTPSVTAGVACC